MSQFVALKNNKVNGLIYDDNKGIITFFLEGGNVCVVKEESFEEPIDSTEAIWDHITENPLGGIYICGDTKEYFLESGIITNPNIENAFTGHAIKCIDNYESVDKPTNNYDTF